MGMYQLSSRLRSSGISFRNGCCLMSNLLSRPQHIFASNISRTYINWRKDKVMLFSPPMAMSSLRIHILCGPLRWHSVRFNSNAIVTLNTDYNLPRFSVIEPIAKQYVQKNGMQKPKRPKMSRKAKLNQLKWYRLKAKKKMRSPNPEVRIRYKLEKALEKYKFQQSLEHTSEFIERLEKELQEYHNHLAMYRKNSEEESSNKCSS